MDKNCKYEQRGGTCSNRRHGNHGSGNGIFVDCNDFDVSENISRRVYGDDNSLVADDNDVELPMDKPYSWNVANDNDVENSQIIFANASLRHCGTSVRISANEDAQVNQLFTSKYDLISKL
ncbi:Hypothetical predicted protein [Olea europaea subsp. europaea]|uniref:Uncharacterized protein n=1 Tax=Olea europaea subsp. europaea TaxID=158383 RepID=A0A8S0PXM3_OLEEU|nr:Hypothetical predicted protein [Olea europaea subsp. europaea]